MCIEPLRGGTVMRAFVIAAETIKDESMFAEYRKAVPATVEAFGGKFIARGGDLRLLEGEWKHPRVVIIEFPSREAAEAWYATAGDLIILEGQD
jgi:uncharacterized protein (DUF1330 family)